jgi:hypothetical protein
VITSRTGELGFLKTFLFRAWIAVDILAEFGGGPTIRVNAYPEQVVSVANRIPLENAFGALPNEIDFRIVDLAETPLPPGRYGIVVEIESADTLSRSFWPATGSELLIVGEAS